MIEEERGEIASKGKGKGLFPRLSFLPALFFQGRGESILGLSRADVADVVDSDDGVGGDAMRDSGKGVVEKENGKIAKEKERRRTKAKLQKSSGKVARRERVFDVFAVIRLVRERGRCHFAFVDSVFVIKDALNAAMV